METRKYYYGVNRGDIAYLRNTLESYDGMVVVRTVDPREAVIELQVAPGCEGLVKGLVKDLRVREGLRLSGVT